jgi:hypothetical protein
MRANSCPASAFVRLHSQFDLEDSVRLLRLSRFSQPQDVVIACRGLALRDDQPVWRVKEDIWPRGHPVAASPFARIYLGFAFKLSGLVGLVASRFHSLPCPPSLSLSRTFLARTDTLGLVGLVVYRIPATCNGDCLVYPCDGDIFVLLSQLPPTLRYRLHPASDADKGRVSSLAHTGEPLREASWVREVSCGQPSRILHSWLEEFPSDLAYNKRLVRSAMDFGQRAAPSFAQGAANKRDSEGGGGGGAASAEFVGGKSVPMQLAILRERSAVKGVCVNGKD